MKKLSRNAIKVLIAAYISLLTPSLAAACDYYAAPERRGAADGKSASNAFVIWDFWISTRAAPGSTLCLVDGVYTGHNGRIETPLGRSGFPGMPITIRALNDGKVLLDPREGPFVVWIRGDYFVVEGINARNGGEAVYSFGGSYNRGRRLIGWDGTSGEANSIIFTLGKVDNVVEDCAGWGMNVRKIFNGSQNGAVNQASGWSGFRRCWGEWNDHPMGVSGPSDTYQVGYNTRQQRFENVLGTWNSLGDNRESYGIVEAFFTCVPNNDMMYTAVLGSIFYVPAGNKFPSEQVIRTFCTSNMVFKDVVSYLGGGHTGARPFYFQKYGSNPPPSLNNVCNNCVAVHNGRPSLNQTGWELRNFREGPLQPGASLENILGAGKSIWTELPGVCKRYVYGNITNEPLWPWPMNQRIKDAMVLAGRTPIDVTGEMEKHFGTIPSPMPDRGPAARQNRARAA